MVFGCGLQRAYAVFESLQKVVLAIGGSEFVGSDHFALSFTTV
jgi:hypothetical protein